MCPRLANARLESLCLLNLIMFLDLIGTLLDIDDLDDLDLDDDMQFDGEIGNKVGDINSDLVEVEGYTREDGTEVASYVRTAPDDDLTNNLGFWDLVNQA